MELHLSLHLCVVAIEKGAFGSPLTKGRQLYLLLQIFKTLEKSEFCVLVKHCSLMGKEYCSSKVMAWLVLFGLCSVEDISRQCIHHFAWKNASMFQSVVHNKKEFLRKYVTMDETWIPHFTPESNRQSAEWTAAGESRPKWQNMQTLAGKVLTSVFWVAQGILFINYLEKERTINSKYYIVLLVCLKE